MFDFTEDRNRLLSCNRHALVIGGPGAGKTTIALIKAGKIVSGQCLKREQRVLFLSFARSTIARVVEQAIGIISAKDRDKIEINTYHGFAWKLIRSYGVLLNQKPICLLSPSDAASRLSAVSLINKSDRGKYREKEKQRLFNEEGLLHFDLFAQKASELLRDCSKIRQIISDSYPVIILDEFQDTNTDEWSMIQLLGEQSLLLALADVEQRIYDFRGADPLRIKAFCEKYSPEKFDFGTDNYRSSSTDIVKFGNDLLSGSHKNRHYKGVFIEKYPFYRDNAHICVKSQVLSALSRLKNNGNEDWSLAVLVPTKKLMIDVSDYLVDKKQRFNGGTTVSHEVALDWEGPVLAAELMAILLEGDVDEKQFVAKILNGLCHYLRGHKGDSPTKDDLTLASGIEKYLSTGKIAGKKRVEILNDVCLIFHKRNNMHLTGSPEDDWLAVRSIIREASSECFQILSNDAKYIRLLHKGTTLRAHLGEIWKQYGDYRGAVIAIKNTLLQDHFVAKSQNLHGVYIMTMHKSKGKQFDEVIVYEGQERHRNRFVLFNADKKILEEAVRLLRVAVTRAKNRVTILTPSYNPSQIFS